MVFGNDLEVPIEKVLLVPIVWILKPSYQIKVENENVKIVQIIATGIEIILLRYFVITQWLVPDEISSNGEKHFNFALSPIDPMVKKCQFRNYSNMRLVRKKYISKIKVLRDNIIDTNLLESLYELL